LSVKLATFCSTPADVELAVTAGADILLLEDSKLSARSFHNDFKTPHFEKIITLANQARELNPAISLVFNCDILIHHRHFPLIKKLIITLKEAQIDRIRVQDPGLCVFFKEHYPQAKLELSTETGNQNIESIAYYSTLFSKQVISPETPLAQLQAIRQSTQTELEVVVHGPLLIQYSNRRFLEGLEDQSSPFWVRQAEDLEYPGRQYRFYDNPHGHFMYLYFDRCLIKHIPDLLSLGFDSWLIDGRGEHPDYLRTALSNYRHYADTPPEPFAIDPTDWETLKATGSRPFKPGFFMANKTDQDREKTPSDFHDQDPIAVVLDILPGESFTLETLTPITLPQDVICLTTKGKTFLLTLEQATTLGSVPPQTKLQAHQLATFPWKKNVVPKSKIFGKIEG
jgi:putative protease